MLTRLKRPSILKQLGITVLLVAFQGYMVYSAISGQYGIDSRKQMLGEIVDLEAQSARLQTEIDAYHHRMDLFDPRKLDPDILTERAQALLAMIGKDDRIVELPKSDPKP